MTHTKLPPIHPGEILLEEFLNPMEITQTELAKEINVPPQTINDIIQGKSNITANIALRLSRYFSLSEFFWLNLQMRYDLETEKDAFAQQLTTEIQKTSVLRYQMTHQAVL
jgi:addiction module HigA family antidote